MGWRDHLPIHPAADLFPLMSESELRELGESIKAHGLKSHLKLYRGKLLDGRNRLEAMELVGVAPDCNGDVAALACPFNHLDERVDPYDYVIALNLHRRHLTAEQKRELIAKVLKAKPGESNRKIAKQTKADHKTVAAVRGELESGGEIPQLEKTTGADGKQYKSRANKKPRRDKRPIKFDPATMGDACVVTAPEAERVTGSAEISSNRRKAEHAKLGEMPTEEEADESWQNDLYDQACLLLERMADATRQRFLAHLTAAPGGDIVEQCLSLLMAMTKDQRAQFFAKYTELSAAKAPARP
jgi:hypothetical protein